MFNPFCKHEYVLYDKKTYFDGRWRNVKYKFICKKCSKTKEITEKWFQDKLEEIKEKHKKMLALGKMVPAFSEMQLDYVVSGSNVTELLEILTKKGFDVSCFTVKRRNSDEYIIGKGFVDALGELQKSLPVPPLNIKTTSRIVDGDRIKIHKTGECPTCKKKMNATIIIPENNKSIDYWQVVACPCGQKISWGEENDF